MKDNKEIISFLKVKGFVFPGSEIYGGLANSWDYGPLGALLKDNIKNLWKSFFIDQQPNTFHFDSSIMLNKKVWEVSGHLAKFVDPMIDCKECKIRYRADFFIEEHFEKNPDSMSFEEMSELIHSMDCPSCKKNNWTDVRIFNLMFKFDNSKLGEGDEIYLRPETAQGIFINFLNIINSINPKLPFGIGQVGKAFRNEVTPGNFIFRTKEFEQLELEYFTTKNGEEVAFDHYIGLIDIFLEKVGLSKNNFRKQDIAKESLAHYSSRTIDYEYNFPFGWGELLGLANRRQFDLSIHSGSKLGMRDSQTNEFIVPSVIETSFGVERLFYAIISEAYTKEDVDGEERIVLKLPFKIAPYKAAVTPLTNKLDNEAQTLFNELLEQEIGPITYVTSGSIGKRYRKQDAIGTPFVITYDFDALEDNSVTIRHRDTMKQARVLIKDIKTYILNNAK